MRANAVLACADRPSADPARNGETGPDEKGQGSGMEQASGETLAERRRPTVTPKPKPFLVRRLLLAGATVLLLAACGQREEAADSTDREKGATATTGEAAPVEPPAEAPQETATPTGWGEAARQEFIESCSAASGGQEAYCACAAEIAEKHYPDMAAFDAGMRNGDPEVAEFLQTTLIRACADRIVRK